MAKNTYIFSQNSPQHFSCEYCDFVTSNKKDFKRHIETIKHAMLTDTYIKVDKKPKSISDKQYICECGLAYRHRQSLHNHRTNKCKLKNIGNDESSEEQGAPITKELVLQLIQQNQKLQEMLFDQSNKMFELAKEGKSITNNTNNTTNNNNHFNLNVFLNEQCKDAINLMDFVDSLNVKLKDLEYTAKTGYVEGISNIFITALSDMNVHKRPLHCSDSKREILYIKDNGVWLKDDEDRTKLTNAIKKVGI